MSRKGARAAIEGVHLRLPHGFQCTLGSLNRALQTPPALDKVCDHFLSTSFFVTFLIVAALSVGTPILDRCGLETRLHFNTEATGTTPMVSESDT